jgi:CheY-like chemotaxis protein
MRALELSHSRPISFASVPLSLRPLVSLYIESCARGLARKSNKSSDRKGLVEVKRLLCVDDSPDMLDMLVDMLHTEFIIVGALPSGSSALAEVANLKPDIILLDVDLGDMTGFVVAEHLRSAGCSAKVVFLSVHESIDFVDAARDVGAVGYVFKSQITRDLINTLHSAV